MGGEGGPKSKMATHPFPLDVEQGRRPGSAAAANPAAPGLGGGRDRGKNGERVAGDRSPASPLAGVTRRGGSATVLQRLGRRWAAAVMAWGVEERRRGPFIGALGR